MEVLAQMPTPTVTSGEEEFLGNHLVLHDISWETYEQLLEIFSDRSIPRITFYRGTLELIRPETEREVYSWNLGQLVAELTAAMGLEIIGFKSSAWRLREQAIGKEADECFYIQNDPKAKLFSDST